MQGTKEKTAIVLPNHLGDAAMATAALRALRAGLPDSEISLVVRRELAGLLEGAPWFDRLIPHDVYGSAGAAGRLRRRIALGRALRGHDTVVVLPNSWSAGWIALASGAGRRVGYARRGRGVLLTRALPAPREGGRFVPIAMERYYLDLVVRGLGCPDLGTELELYSDPESEKQCDAAFAVHGIDAQRPLVCLAPGAGYGPAKLWPLGYVAQLARALLDGDAQVALVHGPGEEALAHEIRTAAGPGLVSLGGEAMTLGLLKAVLARASLLVCNDAGARHVAAAFSVPALVLMGPTSIQYTNLNLKKTRLLREPVACSPCQRKICPIDHRCMTRLLPQRVIREARAALCDPEWRGSLDLEPAPVTRAEPA